MKENMPLFISFAAGLLSFFSPCIIPLIPSYLTFLLGDYAEQQKNDKKYSLIPIIIFTASFSLIFILMGLSASFIGGFLLRNQRIIRKVSGILIIIFGIHLADILHISLFDYEKRLDFSPDLNRHLRALVMGVGLAFAWTPCIGPVLTSVLIYASNAGSILKGSLLLSFYSLGLAVPFLLVALSAGWFLPRFKKIKPLLPFVRKITGVLLIILGILIYTNNL